MKRLERECIDQIDPISLQEFKDMSDEELTTIIPIGKPLTRNNNKRNCFKAESLFDYFKTTQGPHRNPMTREEITPDDSARLNHIYYRKHPHDRRDPFDHRDGYGIGALFNERAHAIPTVSEQSLVGKWVTMERDESRAEKISGYLHEYGVNNVLVRTDRDHHPLNHYYDRYYVVIEDRTDPRTLHKLAKTIGESMNGYKPGFFEFAIYTFRHPAHD